MVDGAVDGGTTIQCRGGVPQVEREPEWLAIQSLREDDALHMPVGEVDVDERLRADSLGRNL